MNSTDERVKAALHAFGGAVRTAPDAWPENVARRAAGRAARPRRYALGLVAVAVGALAVVAAVGIGQLTGSPSGPVAPASGAGGVVAPPATKALVSWFGDDLSGAGRPVLDLGTSAWAGRTWRSVAYPSGDRWCVASRTHRSVLGFPLFDGHQTHCLVPLQPGESVSSTLLRAYPGSSGAVPLVLGMVAPGSGAVVVKPIAGESVAAQRVGDASRAQLFVARLRPDALVGLVSAPGPRASLAQLRVNGCDVTGTVTCPAPDVSGAGKVPSGMVSVVGATVAKGHVDVSVWFPATGGMFCMGTVEDGKGTFSACSGGGWTGVGVQSWGGQAPGRPEYVLASLGTTQVRVCRASGACTDLPVRGVAQHWDWVVAAVPTVAGDPVTTLGALKDGVPFGKTQDEANPSF